MYARKAEDNERRIALSPTDIETSSRRRILLQRPNRRIQQNPGNTSKGSRRNR